MLIIINFLLTLLILYLALIDKLEHPRILFAVAFTVGIWIYFLVTIKNEYNVNQYFVATQCTVTSLQIIQRPCNRVCAYSYTAEIQGTVNINGQTLSQSLLPHISDIEGTFSSIQSMANQYKLNTPYACWYDPKNPSTVVLTKGWYSLLNQWPITVIHLTMLTVVVGMIFF